MTALTNFVAPNLPAASNSYDPTLEQRFRNVLALYFNRLDSYRVAGDGTQVQYNEGGALGASSTFTYDSITTTLTAPTMSPTNITGAALALTIKPKTPTVLEAGGALTIQTPNAVKANTSSGDVSISTGSGLGTGSSGRISLISGIAGVTGGFGGDIYVAAGGSTAGNGGSFTMTAGSGVDGGTYYAAAGRASVGSGGSISFISGDSDGPAGYGGDFAMTAGSCIANAGFGGSFTLAAGNGSTTAGSGGVGGQLALYAGNGDISGGGSNGNIAFYTGSYTNFLAINANSSGAQIIRFFTDGTLPLAPQQTTAIATIARTAVAGGNAIDDNDTFGGYTIGQIVTALKAYGLLA